jgi:hypothetical protein
MSAFDDDDILPCSSASKIARRSQIASTSGRNTRLRRHELQTSEETLMFEHYEPTW